VFQPRRHVRGVELRRAVALFGDDAHRRVDQVRVAFVEHDQRARLQTE
jgi:hypothetical protein